MKSGGLFGTKPPPRDGLPADAPRGRDAERIMWGEMLGDWRAYVNSATKFAERLAGRIVNNVLEVRTVIVDANASPIGLQYKAAIGSLVVRAGAHAVTVVANGAESGPPTSGVGVWIVPANTVDTIAIGGRVATLYATATDVISYQALTAGPITVAN